MLDLNTSMVVATGVADLAGNEASLEVLRAYGLRGLALLLGAALFYKLIDRGFTLQVPPKRK